MVDERGLSLIVTCATVTAALGANGANTTVPVPPYPAFIVRPNGKFRLWRGMLLPRVSVSAALTITSFAEQMDTLPSVVVSAAARFTLRPEFKRTLPLVVVMAAFTLASRPQHTTKLPLVAEMGALIFASLVAFRVRVVVLGAAVQLTASLT